MARQFTRSNSDWLTANPNVIADEPLTMACWFKASINTDRLALVAIGDLSTTNGFWELSADGARASDPIAAYTRAPGGTSQALSTTGFTVGKWHHAGGIWRANDNRSAYIDGGSRGNETTARAAAISDDTCIGRSALSSDSNGMDGAIAEIGIWNIDLSDAEMAILAKGYSPLLIRPNNLVFYIPLIRDDDFDLIGGVSFTANGTPSIVHHSRIFNPRK